MWEEAADHASATTRSERFEGLEKSRARWMGGACGRVVFRLLVEGALGGGGCEV
jgi:hypothetical protein